MRSRILFAVVSVAVIAAACAGSGTVSPAPASSSTAGMASPTGGSSPSAPAVATDSGTGASATPHDAGTPPPFIGTWTVTGYRIGADGSRYLYENGGLRGVSIEFARDGTLSTTTSTRSVTEQWTRVEEGQVLIEGEGTSRTVSYRVEGDTLLLGNTDGSFTEMTRAG